MTKRKWGDRREAVRACSTRDDPQNPGRRTSRGRFSESWKRLSSRQGSTRRSGLGSQQQQVRPCPPPAGHAPTPPWQLRFWFLIWVEVGLLVVWDGWIDVVAVV